jgi:hypothetical protein
MPNRATPSFSHIPTSPKLWRGVSGTSTRPATGSTSLDRTYVYEAVTEKGGFRYVASISTPRFLVGAGKLKIR